MSDSGLENEVMYFLYERPDGSQFTSYVPPSSWDKGCSSLICSELPDAAVIEVVSALTGGGDPKEDFPEMHCQDISLQSVRWSPQDITYLGVEFAVPQELLSMAYKGDHTFYTFPVCSVNGPVLVIKLPPGFPPSQGVSPSNQ